MKRELIFVAALAAVGLVLSCGGAVSSPISDAGRDGGTDAAMSVGSGGSAADSRALGSGGIATGGQPGSGGVSATGGTLATGGTSGANTGGRTEIGGSRAAGGATATGGGAGTSSGGTVATGGVVATGGTSATGGNTATGGTAGTGGSTATGGGAGTSTGGTAATGGNTPTGGTTSLTWEFPSDTQGWVGAFADYPPTSGTGYDLQYGWAALPTEVGPGGGLRLSGNNHSDDLFMYVMRQITGLAPQTSYLLDIVVVIDTNAPADCGGIGGAPGLNVSVKIGASSVEPTSSTDSLGWLRLNIDKGTQSTGGADMKVVGNLGNTNTCPDDTYQPKTFTLSGFSVTSAADGTIWLILGTDSGFEGITTLYYDRVAVTVRPGS